jgi:hypothetical protein
MRIRELAGTSDQHFSVELPIASFIRPQRLFTAEQHVILDSVGKVTAAILDEVLRKVRELFID